MLHYFRRSPAAAAFHNPLDHGPKTAILRAGFQSSRSVRVFPEGWSDAARRFNPEAIAASLDDLLELARRHPEIELQSAVIVFTYDDSRCLTDADREMLWTAFGVPVFEQRLNTRNELLATECEAHTGLHVVGGNGSFPLDTTPCPCGSDAPLLRPTALPASDLEPMLA